MPAGWSVTLTNPIGQRANACGTAFIANSLLMELDDVSMSGADAEHQSELTLRRARNDLERASRLALAGELVTAVTHDLRQPLTAIEMNVAAASAFLRRSSPSIDEALAALDDALAQQRRMGDALQALQDLVVRRDPQRERCDVGAAVQDVVALVQGDALARHVLIELTIDPDAPAISGDPVLVRQALLNILTDALEATSLSERKDAPIRITAHPATGGVEIAIHHLGMRADSARLDGWGLALARSVVAAHDASIALSGTAETGVSVITTWPAHAG
jgi:C4-dicarboxylate-specific signal transduction histidine kinase